jgi:hypothetical protein
MGKSRRGVKRNSADACLEIGIVFFNINWIVERSKVCLLSNLRFFS